MTSVGLMTRGGKSQRPLPHPSLALIVRKTVEDALRLTWQRLHAEKGPKRINTSTAGEVKFTARMVRLLNRLRDQPDKSLLNFSASIFQVVSRGGEVESFDGHHLEKRPDMVFRLVQSRVGVASSEYDGLFVECKIIDKTHSLSSYCKYGLRRFLDGEYAWAMQEALMIAYVRGGRTILKSLAPYLKKRASAYAVVIELGPRQGDKTTKNQVCVSRHARSWQYPSGEKPGQIEIAHLWLDADKVIGKYRTKGKQKAKHS